MKSPLLKPELLRETYANRKEEYKFNYIGQELQVFFGRSILNDKLKYILDSNPAKVMSEEMDSIMKISDIIKNKFGSDENSRYILTLGGAIVIGEGKAIRNEDRESKLISVPTTCSNDAFFTNKYKKEEGKYHGSNSAALSGLMPDFLIVDTEMIKNLVTEDIIYAGWGEFLATITSYNDWRENNKDSVDKEDLQILDELIDKMFKDAGSILKNKDVNETIDDLMFFLFMKCLFMMVYDDNTIGASSDHMIGYALQELGFCDELRHGPKVLFGAIVSSACYSLIDQKDLCASIPKKMIRSIMRNSCFGDLLNPQDLKSILDKAILSRQRKTIFDRISEDSGFYKNLEKEIRKCLEI